jgi:hypothetical protein
MNMDTHVSRFVGRIGLFFRTEGTSFDDALKHCSSLSQATRSLLRMHAMQTTLQNFYSSPPKKMKSFIPSILFTCLSLSLFFLMIKVIIVTLYFLYFYLEVLELFFFFWYGGSKVQG